MDRRIVVTGLGVVSPVGSSIDKFWNSFCEGRGGVGLNTTFDVSEFDCKIAAEVRDFDPSLYISQKDLKRLDKFVQYALAASIMAVKDSGLDILKLDPYRIGVLVGSGMGSLHIIEEEHKVLLAKGPSRITPYFIPTLIVNMAAGYIAIHFKAKGPNSCIATACATGSHAIGDAFRIIQRGDADIMITGGTESCITPLSIGGFCAMKVLSTRNNEPQHASRPFDRDRDGFVMGEGAGIVILEELEHARSRSARIYAEVAGYGMTADAYHMTAPCPDGDGAAKAMEVALNDARFNPDDISYINAHGTSTQLNDKIETLAIKRVFGSYAKKVPISSTKSMTGHLLGAAGGVEFIACCLSIYHNIVPPTINYVTPDPECDLDYCPNTARKIPVRVALSNSLGFGGHNATLIVKKFT